MADKKLNANLVLKISEKKKEPVWMKNLRLRALSVFNALPLPRFGPDLSGLDFSKINYFKGAGIIGVDNWEKLPKKILQIYEDLEIPEMSERYFGASLAQYESEVVYESLKQQWQDQGIIFLNMDQAVKQYPEMIKPYFMQLVKPEENKFTALHTAFWSGGSFIYVPKNVQVDLPMQAYFRMQKKNLGQFEHTIIIADEGSSVHYLEGCTAPVYTTASLHSSVIEIYVKKNAKVRYSTVQNWSKNVYNLNTKRATVEENGRIEWVGGSLGSKVTMLYPTSILAGRGASSQQLSLTWAGSGQIKDTGGKVIHRASETSSLILSKNLVNDGGQVNFRGLIEVEKGAKNIKSQMRCDSLILDEKSKVESYPSLKIMEKEVEVGHEATVGRINDEQLFYLQSRGLTEREAVNLIIQGFTEPIVSEIPDEYAVELKRLMEMEMKC